jgi:hypothetical protein
MSKHVEPSHERSFVNFEKPYETNIIGLRGVIYFGVGLFLLIVITFGLMWFLQNVMEQQARDTKDKRNPLAMSAEERLPPEPRLQTAPGFGVETQNNGVQGRTNLELRAPQSEYRVLKSEWDKLSSEGQRDAQSGTVVTLPLDEAKAKFLEQSAGAAAANQDGQKMLDESRRMVSYSSAGRTASDQRR